MLLGASIFLDVDDLRSIDALEEHIGESAVITLFVSKGYFLSKSELPTRNPTPRAHQYVSATVVSTQQGITRYEGYFLPTPFAC